MFKQTILIMECSRIFALPTTIFSWLVIFTFSIINSGNILYGILAFVGLCLVHLGTNVVDDYFDYKSLIKQVNFDKQEYLKQSQKTKCRYLISGMLKEKDILILSGIYFFLACLIGVYLFFKCGNGVINYAVIGAIIAISYPFISRICLSEVAVSIAYGPALFGGIYYVMTGTNSNEVFLLSIPTMLMTTILLYIHTVMDYEYDIQEGKKTIANRFESQLDSLIILKYLLFFAYISPILLCVADILDWQVFLVYLTAPLAIDLYNSLKDFSCNPEHLPEKKWYHFPMENLEKLKERGEASFMIRIYQARNLMMYYSLLITGSIVLSLWL